MIESPQIMQTSEQRLAVIHLAIPRAEIRKAMGPGLAELRAAVAAQGIAVNGPWLTHHLKMVPDTFDFEICVPVAGIVAAVGRVEPGVLPARNVARTIFHGGYEGLGGAWSEFTGWMEAQGLKPAPDLWEIYAAGPESNPDPATWRTELIRPLE
jgi:effector-binding domain-containing protein